MEYSLLLDILAIVGFIVSVFTYREYKVLRIIELLLIEAIIIILSIDTIEGGVIPGLMIIFGLILIPYTPDKHIWETDKNEEYIAEQQEPKN